MHAEVEEQNRTFDLSALETINPTIWASVRRFAPKSRAPWATSSPRTSVPNVAGCKQWLMIQVPTSLGRVLTQDCCYTHGRTPCVRVSVFILYKVVVHIGGFMGYRGTPRRIRKKCRPLCYQASITMREGSRTKKMAACYDCPYFALPGLTVS